MRYDKGHKEETRKKIVEVASAAFRREGIDGIGVADVMKRAGLTHGGFYSHFKSKEELVKEAVASAFSQSRLRKGREEGKSVEELIRSYLRPEHRDRLDGGCAMAALVGDFARRPKANREDFATRIGRMIGLIEEVLPSALSPAARKKKATGIVATLVGALQLARTETDPKASDAILEAGIDAALSQVNS
ncbi:transcriptional regulator, TetR family [Verrucomicrobium sp. GAS474]|uniref:TetR/AcrR family transcriptional regulator n=1 Tax=Verrucomicrobium sp. GAS474 TaxID=1882831 RepID=UPI00087AC967|nr:TetR/AcrR family transcriptional regulator [Verrucomicrobium sp. GAS474]SDU03636.1 transcriptional regulator, TetR family [Verrucomicrobium sp. GAS474]